MCFILTNCCVMCVNNNMNKDKELLQRIESIDNEINDLGEIGSKDFDWLSYEKLTEESAQLYSKLSSMNSIVSSLKEKYK